MQSWPVLSELKGSHLLLARRPPSFLLDVLLYGRHWGLSRWRPATDPRGQRPRPRIPSTATYGVVAARRPPMDVNSELRTYRNLCCTGYAATCQPGTLRMVMWRCLRSRPVEVYGRCDPCLHEDPGQED